MAKGTTEQLGDLHGVIARELIRRIEANEASAADIGAAIKFLKDNEITADVNTNNHLKGLQEQLVERAKRREARRLHLVGEAPDEELTQEEVIDISEQANGTQP